MLALVSGLKGAKKFLDRYDKQRGKRFTTVEIIVEESDWTPPADPIA